MADERIFYVLKDLERGDYLQFCRGSGRHVYHWSLRRAMDFGSEKEAYEYAEGFGLKHLVALPVPGEAIWGV